MTDQKQKDRQLVLDGLHKICRDICHHDSSTVEDSDGWCELVWLSCEEDGDAVWEHSRMVTILDDHGITHENTSLPPEFWGYSEYTPDPGWVMRIKVKLDGEGISNELRLAMSLSHEEKLRRKWSQTAYSLHKELKSYADLLSTDYSGGAYRFIREAYEKNPQLYDEDPSRFPTRSGYGVTAMFKSFYPMATIDGLTAKAIPILGMLNKEPKE